MTNIETLEPEVVGRELEKVEREAGIDKPSSEIIRGNFAQYYGEVVKWREQAATVTDAENVEHQKVARTVRLGLKKVRCEIENERKRLKADSLARGKAIDGFANVLKYLCEPVENKLLEVEQHAERVEAARIAALVAERSEKLVAEQGDPAAYNLGAMDDATFTAVLETARRLRIEREESERKAESDRIERERAEAEERERIVSENARLKAEAVDRERLAAIEQQKADEERRRVAAELAVERAKAEKAIAAERAERERVEREAEAVREAERKRIADAEEAEASRIKAEADAKRASEVAPDRTKLLRYAAEINAAKVPDMATDDGCMAIVQISAKVDELVSFIRRCAGRL